jgi:hypothetical protein
MNSESQSEGHFPPQFQNHSFGSTWVEPLEEAVHMICTVFFTPDAGKISSPQETERDKSECPSEE